MNRVFRIAVLAGLTACGAENLPPVETDVLVVGGTAKGVAAAVAAKAEGADVFLVTPFTYLGEDMAGTLELGLPDGQKPTTALVKKLVRIRAGSTRTTGGSAFPSTAGRPVRPIPCTTTRTSPTSASCAPARRCGAWR